MIDGPLRYAVNRKPAPKYRTPPLPSGSEREARSRYIHQGRPDSRNTAWGLHRHRGRRKRCRGEAGGRGPGKCSKWYCDESRDRKSSQLCCIATAHHGASMHDDMEVMAVFANKLSDSSSPCLPLHSFLSTHSDVLSRHAVRACGLSSSPRLSIAPGYQSQIRAASQVRDQVLGA